MFYLRTAAVVVLVGCSGAGGGEAQAPPRAPAASSAKGDDAGAATTGQGAPSEEPGSPPDPMEVVSESARGDVLAAEAVLVVRTEMSPDQRLRLLADLAERYVHLGKPEGASAVLDLADTSLLDDEALARLGEGYASAGDVGSAARVLELISSTALVDELRAEMIRALCDGDELDAAQQMLSLLDQGDAREEALAHLASCHASMGRVDQAVHVAATIADPVDRASALVDVVREAARNGYWTEALEVASTLEDPTSRASAFLAVGKARISDGDPALAVEALGKALAAGKEAPEASAPVLSAVAAALVQAGDLNTAWSASKAIPDPVQAGWGLGAIAILHATEGNAFMAGKVAENIQDEGVRVGVLDRIIEIEVEQGLLEQATEMARLIKKMDEDGYLDALCDLAAGVAQEDDDDLGDQLVMWAGSSEGREKVRGCLAVEFTRAGDDATASGYLSLMSTDVPKVLLDLARIHASRGETGKVKAIAAKLEGADLDRARLHLVRSLAFEDELEKALAIVPDIQTDRIRARSLLVLAGAHAQKSQYEQALDLSVQAAAIAEAIAPKHFWSDLDPYDGKAERALVYISGREQGEARVKTLGECIALIGTGIETTEPQMPALLDLLVAPVD